MNIQQFFTALAAKIEPLWVDAEQEAEKVFEVAADDAEKLMAWAAPVIGQFAPAQWTELEGVIIAIKAEGNAEIADIFTALMNKIQTGVLPWLEGVAEAMLQAAIAAILTKL